MSEDLDLQTDAVPSIPLQNPLVSMEIDCFLYFRDPATLGHATVQICMGLDDGGNASIRGVEMVPHVVAQLQAARKVLIRQIKDGGPNFVEDTVSDTSRFAEWRIRYELEPDGSVVKRYDETDSQFFVRLTPDGRLDFPDRTTPPAHGQEIARMMSITVAEVIGLLGQVNQSGDGSRPALLA